jgi:hypothetical protein
MSIAESRTEKPESRACWRLEDLLAWLVGRSEGKQLLLSDRVARVDGTRPKKGCSAKARCVVFGQKGKQYRLYILDGRTGTEFSW